MIRFLLWYKCFCVRCMYWTIDYWTTRRLNFCEVGNENENHSRRRRRQSETKTLLFRWKTKRKTIQILSIRRSTLLRDRQRNNYIFITFIIIKTRWRRWWRRFRRREAQLLHRRRWQHEEEQKQRHRRWWHQTRWTLSVSYTHLTLPTKRIV